MCIRDRVETTAALAPDRFREELVNKFAAALPAPYHTATDKQMHAKVCTRVNLVMLYAP